MESHLTLVLSESGKCSLRVPTSAFGPQRRWEQTVRPPPLVSAAMTPGRRACGSSSGRPSPLRCGARAPLLSSCDSLRFVVESYCGSCHECVRSPARLCAHDARAPCARGRGSKRTALQEPRSPPPHSSSISCLDGLSDSPPGYFEPLPVFGASALFPAMEREDLPWRREVS